MARRGRRAKANGRSADGQYMTLSYDIVQSPAFRCLSGAALKVWFELRSRFNGSNNSKLILSYEEAARLLKLGKATVARAFSELQEKGFIVLHRKGQWYGRLANEWSTTDRPVNGTPATNAWKRWQPPAPAPQHWLESENGSDVAPSVPAFVPTQN